MFMFQTKKYASHLAKDGGGDCQQKLFDSTHFHSSYTQDSTISISIVTAKESYVCTPGLDKIYIATLENYAQLHVHTWLYTCGRHNSHSLTNSGGTRDTNNSFDFGAAL